MAHQRPPLIPNPDKVEPVEFITKGRAEGYRIDKYLSTRYEGYSRSYIQKLIKEGYVLINGQPCKKGSIKIKKGDRVEVNLPVLEELHLNPEEFPLEIIYEDEYIAAINKPPDLVIHPARGHLSGTLVNALLFHFSNLSDMSDVYRPGVVHRLDRFTSGIILVAKNNMAHSNLSMQFEERTIQKVYLALVEGEMKVDEDIISLPLGMDPRNRERVAVCHGGKNAVTVYKVLRRFPGYTWVEVYPKTGRTHQIRVHLKALGHTLVADSLYDAKPALLVDDLLAMVDPSKRNELKAKFTSEGIVEDELIARQALHAYSISFEHPTTKERLTLTASLPSDLEKSLRALNLLSDTIESVVTETTP